MGNLLITLTDYCKQAHQYAPSYAKAMWQGIREAVIALYKDVTNEVEGERESRERVIRTMDEMLAEVEVSMEAYDGALRILSNTYNSIVEDVHWKGKAKDARYILNRIFFEVFTSLLHYYCTYPNHNKELVKAVRVPLEDFCMEIAK